MKYGSVCSGIEAASVAWHHLGWKAQWFSEIEHFPSEVLKYRFPTVENLGDMTKLTTNETFKASTIDLLVGGTPCQSFSVAGLRGGLADPRGNLMLTFLSLADSKKPRWIVWENVVGVLSSNGGKDFGTFLGALGELGYGFAYRVLDAQHFGVAQRRRRVFVVGYLGDWRPAAAVLFERESLSRDFKSSRKKGQETSTDAQGGVRATGDVSCAGGNISPCVTSKWETGSGGPSGDETRNMVYEQIAQPIPIHDQATRFQGKRGDKQDGKGNGLGIGNEGDVMNTLTKADKHAVAQPIAYSFDSLASNSMKSSNPHSGCRKVETSKTIDTTIPEPSKNQGGIAVAQPIAVDCYNQTINEKTSQTIGSSRSDVNHYGAVLETMAIRRLTPKECERLQGFPDDWTKIPYRNKPADQCPDGPRYKACGNSMAVPVMRWIGQRIQLIDTIIN